MRTALLALVLTLTFTTPAFGETVTYEYDPNGNVLIRQTPSQTDTAGYDTENRITIDTSGDGLQRQFQYDANGNRIQYQVDTFSETLTYAPNTNRLTNRATNVIQTDQAGNITDDGQYLYSYNNAGRLKQVTRKSDNQLLATYTYNAKGQRTRKVTTSGTTVYHYDIYGNLIQETTDTGIYKKDYIYLENRPIAQIDINNQVDTITYLHTDHLDTPRVATDANQNAIWVWRGEAFGSLQPDQGAVVINLRFPGMYFDSETGLFYNWNRYYDPKTGRYITSDPIGLDGGLNDYSYVDSNPLRLVDPDGLSGQPTMGATLLRRGPFREAQTEFASAVVQSVIPGSGIPDALETGGPEGLLLLAMEVPGIKVVKTVAKVCKVARAESSVWKSLKPWRGKTKTNGLSGKERKYYEYDSRHGEIEVYNARGEHLGAMNPESGQMVKPAVKGRYIDI